MMASRIYRKLSSCNFLNIKSVYTNFHLQQTSVTASNKKLASQNLTKPYSQNHHSDYYSHFVKGRSNLNHKSLNNFASFLSSSNPNKMNFPVETMMKSVHRLSMISAGFGLSYIGLRSWISVTSSSISAVSVVVGLLAFGIPYTLASFRRLPLNMINTSKEKEGLQFMIQTFKVNKNFVRLIGVSYLGLAGAMLSLVYVAVSK